MPKNDPYYYTAKQIDAMRFDFYKWEEFNDELPIATYEIFPYGGPGGRGACGCPAYKRCKHLNAISEIIHQGRVSQLPGLKWTSAKGWEEISW